MLKTIIKSVAVTAGIAVTLSSGAFAQDTTYLNVPFQVNVAASVTAVQDDDTVSIDVEANTKKNLRIPLQINVVTSVWHTVKTHGRLNAPIVSASRGNISLRLPAQSYSNAEVALYSVNGKRILRGKANAKDAVNRVSRKNVAAGVYMLSVKGANGTFTNKLTHSGGNMNINVVFGTESVSPARQLGKQAEDVEWDWEWKITVSSLDKDSLEESGYLIKDSTFTLDIQMMSGYAEGWMQNITLLRYGKPTPTITTFTDDRDGKTYKKVAIGTQTWMAENLNYAGDDEDNLIGVCYNNSPDSCAKYGRLYAWGTAMNGASSSSADPSGVQGVCPAGWHLPSGAEWEVLVDYVCGWEKSGTSLKSSTGWNNDSDVPTGTDEYGFSALPSGSGSWDGYFYSAGVGGGWWSATTDRWGTQRESFSWQISGYNQNASAHSSYPSSRLSVRCVQDVEEEEGAE